MPFVNFFSFKECGVIRLKISYLLFGFFSREICSRIFQVLRDHTASSRKGRWYRKRYQFIFSIPLIFYSLSFIHLQLHCFEIFRALETSKQKGEGVKKKKIRQRIHRIKLYTRLLPLIRKWKCANSTTATLSSLFSKN